MNWQLDAGGWAMKPEYGPSHDHTMVLALWVLLEVLYLEVEDILWILSK